MKFLLAVDPGINGCGVAHFVDKRLNAAAYLPNPLVVLSKTGLAEVCASMARRLYPWAEAEELAVEWPRVYASRIRGGKSLGDPNDLLGLAGVVSAVSALYGVRTDSYTPSEWKGQLTKEACKARIISRLSDKEMKVAEAAAKYAKSKAHNMFDAIGIGLHHLGRFERKRVVP